MGELMQVGSGPVLAPGVVGALLSLGALALYALVGANRENDDDDSTPGGGLMQPVA
jgi:hypothetical protein